MLSEKPLGPRVDFRPPDRPPRSPMRGAHVMLRPVDPSRDTDALYAQSHPPTGDYGIWTYLFDGPYTDADEFRRALHVAQTSEDPLFHTITTLPGEQPVGVASYLRITPEHGVIEIGNIWFGPALQRSTGATEAIYLLAQRAFDELGYRRLEWKCNALNAASRRAAERFGFQFEGIFRQHMVVKGRNRDTAWYAILDHEWPAIRACFEAWLSPENFAPDGLQLRSLRELMAR